MAALRAATSRQTLVKVEPSRVQRHKVHTDAIFDQLMEAHINSKCHKDDEDPSSSQLLTSKNFGARTGLNWPEGRVAREIVGLIGGFTQEQEDKLTQMRNNGRAVVDILAYTTEFSGRGHPERFPYKSRQQIAAKLLDMFGYTKLKSIVSTKADVAASSGRGNSSSSSSKVYVYQDGGGTVTLEPATAGATAVPPSSAMAGSNIVHNISYAACVPATSRYSPYSAGGRYYRDREPFPSTFWDRSEPAKGLRFSTSTTITAPESRFSKHGPAFSGGVAGSGDGGVCGFAETNRQGACDDMMDKVGLFSANGAGGGGDGGSGMGGGCRPSRAGGSGYGAVDGAGHFYPRSSLPPKPSPTSARAHQRFMESLLARDGYTRKPESGEYATGEPAWNGGGTEKSAGFPRWLVPPSSPSNRPAVQKSSMISSCLLPPEMRGPTNFPNHSPSAVANRFANGRSTMYLPPPLPPLPAAQPRDCYLPPSDRFRKKPRTPLTAMTGVATPSAPSVDGPNSAIEAPSAIFHPFFSHRTHHRFGSIADDAEGPTGSFGGKGISMAACTTAYSAAGGSFEKQSRVQLVKSFPASVSLAEQTSLRLAFGAALTEEAWLLGTSALLGAELKLD